MKIILQKVRSQDSQEYLENECLLKSVFIKFYISSKFSSTIVSTNISSERSGEGSPIVFHKNELIMIHFSLKLSSLKIHNF